MRCSSWAGLTVVPLLLAACGTATDAGAPTSTAEDVQIVEPGEELVGHGMLMQSSADAPVEICVGGVAESLPPQCGGPVLRGAFSWEELQPERAAGVTWADGVWVVGTYDAEAGEGGTFTLTRPVSTEPPEGFARPTPEQSAFPQLCDDPFRGGQEGYADPADQEELGRALQDLDGYVTSWVSDGSSMFNVVVTSDTDAEETHGRLREVWKGGLCVESRDLPPEQDVRAAQDALAKRFSELGLLGAGSGVSGLLDVGVVVTDRQTVDAVRETVAPWLTPDQVVITGALRPLDNG
ncbi:hypothetical protein [Ornithinimicrobium tianjinense]|uniref:Sporulation and spore germination n=1 Tax=Ornithinimicrobium tianjinense TaxID=1195761 RepID=A0A917BSE8_9MICO|nr:hypothetical protein [Ornithinimicrobium tianjinense]GGF55108.1 hypothetical protein GCM10011366_23740 [Ornithinimicrobium tianjinense]